MAYRVKSVQRKKGPQFKIRYEWFENGQRKSRDIPKDEWPHHGFNLSMTRDEANAQKDSRNKAEHLKRQDARRNKIQARLKEETAVHLAFLPAVFIQEFETRLFGRTQRTKKLAIYWNTAKHILCELRLEPESWADECGKFYDLFSKRQYSISYVRTLVPLINSWGVFYSKKTQKFFEPLPAPKGIERARIDDANQESGGAGNKESDPITPAMIEKVRSRIAPEHYNWLYITVWLGLLSRPRQPTTVSSHLIDDT
jgi:hypothetical protein